MPTSIGRKSVPQIKRNTHKSKPQLSGNNLAIHGNTTKFKNFTKRIHPLVYCVTNQPATADAKGKSRYKI